MDANDSLEDLDRLVLALERKTDRNKELDGGFDHIAAFEVFGITPTYFKDSADIVSKVQDELKKNPDNEVVVVSELVDETGVVGLDLYNQLKAEDVLVIVRGDVAAVSDIDARSSLIQYLTPGNLHGNKATLNLVVEYDTIGQKLFEEDVFSVLPSGNHEGDSNLVLQEEDELPEQVVEELKYAKNVLYLTRGNVPKVAGSFRKYDLLPNSVIHWLTGMDSLALEEGILPESLNDALAKSGPYDVLIVDKKGKSGDGKVLEFSDVEEVADRVSKYVQSNGLCLYIDEDSGVNDDVPIGFRQVGADMDLVHELAGFTQNAKEQAIDEANQRKDKQVILENAKFKLIKTSAGNGKIKSASADYVGGKGAQVSKKNTELVQAPTGGAFDKPPVLPIVEERTASTELVNPVIKTTKHVLGRYEDVNLRMVMKYVDNGLKSCKGLVQKVVGKYHLSGANKNIFYNVLDVLAAPDTELPNSYEGNEDYLGTLAEMITNFSESWTPVGEYVFAAITNNTSGRYVAFNNLNILASQAGEKLNPIIAMMIKARSKHSLETAVTDVGSILSMSQRITEKDDAPGYLHDVIFAFSEQDGCTSPLVAEGILYTRRAWTLEGDVKTKPDRSKDYMEKIQSSSGDDKSILLGPEDEKTNNDNKDASAKYLKTGDAIVREPSNGLENELFDELGGQGDVPVSEADSDRWATQMAVSFSDECNDSNGSSEPIVITEPVIQEVDSQEERLQSDKYSGDLLNVSHAPDSGDIPTNDVDKYVKSIDRSVPEIAESYDVATQKHLDSSSTSEEHTESLIPLDALAEEIDGQGQEERGSDIIDNMFSKSKTIKSVDKDYTHVVEVIPEGGSIPEDESSKYVRGVGELGESASMGEVTEDEIMSEVSTLEKYKIPEDVPIQDSIKSDDALLNDNGDDAVGGRTKMSEQKSIDSHKKKGFGFIGYLIGTAAFAGAMFGAGKQMQGKADAEAVKGGNKVVIEQVLCEHDYAKAHNVVVGDLADRLNAVADADADLLGIDMGVKSLKDDGHEIQGAKSQLDIVYQNEQLLDKVAGKYAHLQKNKEVMGVMKDKYLGGDILCANPIDENAVDDNLKAVDAYLQVVNVKDEHQLNYIRAASIENIWSEVGENAQIEYQGKKIIAAAEIELKKSIEAKSVVKSRSRRVTRKGRAIISKQLSGLARTKTLSFDAYTHRTGRKAYD